MPNKSALIRHKFPIFLLGVALGYLFGWRAHYHTLDEIAGYRDIARNSRRNAEELRKELDRRQHAGT